MNRRRIDPLHVELFDDISDVVGLLVNSKLLNLGHVLQEDR